MSKDPNRQVTPDQLNLFLRAVDRQVAEMHALSRRGPLSGLRLKSLIEQARAIALHCETFEAEASESL